MPPVRWGAGRKMRQNECRACAELGLPRFRTKRKGRGSLRSCARIKGPSGPSSEFLRGPSRHRSVEPSFTAAPDTTDKLAPEILTRIWCLLAPQQLPWNRASALVSRDPIVVVTQYLTFRNLESMEFLKARLDLGHPRAFRAVRRLATESLHYVVFYRCQQADRLDLVEEMIRCDPYYVENWFFDDKTKIGRCLLEQEAVKDPTSIFECYRVEGSSSFFEWVCYRGWKTSALACFEICQLELGENQRPSTRHICSGLHSGSSEMFTMVRAGDRSPLAADPGVRGDRQTV